MRKVQNFTFFLFVAFLLNNCSDSSNNPSESRSDLLTAGIWAVASDSEIGEVGVQLRFFSNGLGQTLDGGTIDKEWNWSLSDDESELTVEYDNIEIYRILELTNTTFSGRVINNSTNNGKLLKLKRVS